MKDNPSKITSVYSDDYFGWDSSATLLITLLKSSLIYFFQNLGISDSIIAYWLTFGLIFLTSLLYYGIWFSVTKSRLFWIFGVFLIIINNLTIENIYFGFIFNYFISLFGLWVLAYILYIIIRDNELRLRYILYIAMLSLSIVAHIYFILYVWIILLFFIYLLIAAHEGRASILMKWVFTILLIITINSYWIVPFVSSLLSSWSWEIYQGNVDNVYNAYKSHVSYINTISLRQYFNNISFKLYDSSLVYFYYAFINFIVFIWLILMPKGSNLRQYYILLLLVFLLFFNISLWPNSVIPWGLWNYIWDNYSFFHFFRSFTRFMIILPILIFCFFAILYTKKIFWKKIIISVILLAIMAHPTLFTWNLSGRILTMSPIKELYDINWLLWRDSSLLILPNNPYESYLWLNKQSLQTYFFSENFFSSPVTLERDSINLRAKNATFSKIFRNNIYPELLDDI